MDRKLAKAIADMGVTHFGKSRKNQEDSQSCLFDPRRLLSSPEMLAYIGKQLARVATTDCRGDTLIGMATSGIAWGAVCSIYSGLPFSYIRKEHESQTGRRIIEGMMNGAAKLIIVDDLIFTGESKNRAITSIKEHGIEVTDIIIIIDRQLQRKKDGPPIQKRHNVRLHALITMEEIIHYYVNHNRITQEQLMLLRRDYRQYDRWKLPAFAA